MSATWSLVPRSRLAMTAAPSPIPEAAAAPAITPETLQLLREPAWVEMAGRPMTAAARQRLAAAVRGAVAVLVELTQRDVRLRWAGDGVAVAGAVVFTADLCWHTAAGDERSARIGVDLDAARALVDALARRHGCGPGAGPLSAVERGMLEYLALELADALLGHGDGVVVLRRLVHAAGDETAAAGGFEGCMWLDVGGRRGQVLLMVPADILPPAAAADGASRLPKSIGGETDLAFALPPVAVAADDWRAAAPGDLLLLGSQDLRALGAGGRLVTAQGWEVAGAVLVAESPRAVSVRCATPRITPLARPGAADAAAVVHPLLGRRTVALADLADLAAGASFDLAIDPLRPLRLLPGLPGGACHGELVAVDDELAVRLLP